MTSDGEIMDFVKAAGMPIGSQDVAEEFGMGQPNALDRLNQLAEAGRLEHRKIGNINVFWVPDD